MRRHKTNWERVIAAIDSIVGNEKAVEVLRRELMPKYEGILAKREKAKASAAKYRATANGRARHSEYNKAYAAEYRANNRERCNRASVECHRRKRAEAKARKESEAAE